MNPRKLLALGTLLFLFVVVATAADQPKKKFRVGIAPIENQSALPISRNELRMNLMQELISKLVEPLMLKGEFPHEIEADARQRECDFILYVQVSVARQGDPKIGVGKQPPWGQIMTQPRGSYLVRLHYRLMEVASGKKRLEETATATSLGDGTVQDAATNALRTIRRDVLDVLRKL